MDENLRSTFRVPAVPGLDAHLRHDGRSHPCSIENLSAGGARLESPLVLPPGAGCMLAVRVLDPSTPAVAVPFLEIPMEVLERLDEDSNHHVYRLHSLAPEGSKDYEAAMHLVFDAQRRARALQTGADQASPMVSDETRRDQLRTSTTQRFSSGSLRPGTDDDSD